MEGLLYGNAVIMRVTIFVESGNVFQGGQQAA